MNIVSLNKKIQKYEFANMHVDNVTANKDYYVINFIINNIVIKIMTDLSTFCYTDSKHEKSIEFNTDIIFVTKTDVNIITTLNNVFSESKILDFDDKYHIYNNVNEFTKYKVDYNALISISDNTIINGNNTSYKLLSNTMIKKIIIAEMKMINTNSNHNHYIFSNDNTIFNLTLRLFLDANTVLGKQLKENIEYKYIELNISLDSKGYPYIAPKITYIKPNADISFIMSIMNLDILKHSNWSHVISLETLILALVEQLHTLDKQYIMYNDNDNIYSQIIKLAHITKVLKYNKIHINLDKKKLCDKKSHWVGGTGYGSDNDTKWDINMFIKEQDITNQEHGKALVCLYDALVEEKKISIDNINNINQYIMIQIKNINLLEFQKNINIYINLFNIVDFIINHIDQTMINIITTELEILYGEINYIITNGLDKDTIYPKMISIIDKYKSKYIEIIKEIDISSNDKTNYCAFMKKLQFGHYDLTPNHLYYEHSKQKIEQKSVMKILSEISTLKQNLPLSWESSIWAKISKSHMNMIILLISGPKDTPYENGMFEFHIHLPINYPASPPMVLLKTTGGGNVRFNPNLYANGKVCLSLLGTWSGASGETWTPGTSSLIQVLVSIQSLIFVDDPYFNEPGYEKYMKDPIYIDASRKYNEEKQYNTIKLAMNNMLTNPTPGFEEIIKEHFIRKKDEIINKMLIWEQKSKTNGQMIKQEKDIFISLIDNQLIDKNLAGQQK